MKALNSHVACLVLALAITHCLFEHATTHGWSWTIYQGIRWTMVIKNELSNHKKLFIHCRSRDDDLGTNWLGPGVKRDWSFAKSIWGKTRFWCLMRKDRNHHVRFDIFRDDKTFEDSLMATCRGSSCTWIAGDHGIYLRDVLGNRDVYQHSWISGSGGDQL